MNKRLRELARVQDTIITSQSQLITTLQRERAEMQLDFAREMQGVFASWLISIEMPETDMRETLAAAEQALAEKIAMLEEHVL